MWLVITVVSALWRQKQKIVDLWPDPISKAMEPKLGVDGINDGGRKQFWDLCSVSRFLHANWWCLLCLLLCIQFCVVVQPDIGCLPSLSTAATHYLVYHFLFLSCLLHPVIHMVWREGSWGSVSCMVYSKANGTYPAISWHIVFRF